MFALKAARRASVGRSPAQSTIVSPRAPRQEPTPYRAGPRIQRKQEEYRIVCRLGDQSRQRQR